MKKGIHPNYHRIEVEMTNGERFVTFSTWGKEGSVFNLDVDVNKHPAWSGKQTLNFQQDKGQVARFSKRFVGMNFTSK